MKNVLLSHFRQPAPHNPLRTKTTFPKKIEGSNESLKTKCLWKKETEKNRSRLHLAKHGMYSVFEH